jgi:hypothetical protein
MNDPGLQGVPPLFMVTPRDPGLWPEADREELRRSLERECNARLYSPLILDPVPFEIIPLEPRPISLADFIRRPVRRTANERGEG